MTQTVWGVVVDKDGLGAKEVAVQGVHGPELRTASWSTAATEVRAVQPATIPIRLNHGPVVGQVVHLERRSNGDLLAVGEVSDDVRPHVVAVVGGQQIAVGHDLYWSAGATMTRDYTDIELEEISIVAHPAQVNGRSRPLTFRPGRLDYRTVPTERWGLQPGPERELLERAAATVCDRRAHGGPIIVAEPGRDGASEDFARSTLEVASSRRPVETRSAEVADVSYPERTVEIVAAPYGIDATVPYQGRMVKERFSNRAFADVDRQENRSRIRVWKDHQPTLACGRVTTLDPFDPAGLIAQFKLSRTTLGDEALELAKDGVLDASVGFRVLDERWEGTSRRTVTKAWLHHLGLTSDPAYDGTHVLAVRHEFARV